MTGLTNGNVRTVHKGPRSSSARSGSKRSVKKEKEYCVCKGPDDGRPMIKCELCDEWYHLECVNLLEREVEEIQLYVCGSCHEKTGYSSIMEWEGPDVIEMVESPRKALSEPPEETLAPESSDGESLGSGDEYTEERPRGVHGKSPTKKGRTSRQIDSSEDESDGVVSGSERHKGPASSSLKRKGHSANGASKRQKTGSADLGVVDDPVRKYCLTKLKDIILPIFRKYSPSEPEQTADAEGQDVESKRILVLAVKFADELEQALFDNYAELDKKSKRAAIGKYKERFRTISFNLDKPDRAVLHRRIATNTLLPADLAKMTSADLANEQTKQEIVNAQQESMNQSILLDAKAVPLAKRTHKGEEIIETFNEELLRQQKEDEEKRERERSMRLRIPANTSTGAVPPLSAVPDGTSPTASPKRTTFSSEPVPPSATTSVPPIQPFFTPVSDTFVPVEPALDLSEFIEIDLPESPKLKGADVTPELSVQTSLPPTPSVPDTPLVVTQTFTALPDPKSPTEQLQRTSFDLNSLWNKPLPPPEPSADAMDVLESTSKSPEHRMDSMPMEVQMPVTVRADDGDFDMLLADDGPDPVQAASEPTKTIADQQKEVYNALPQVWGGTLNMPYDSSTTYSPFVTAKQIAGRTLGEDPEIWRILFPTYNPTIDGRVPTDQSAKYLVQSRLSSSKELIAVSFTPSSLEHRVQYDQMYDFLVGKERHGLIFPWGKHPKHEPPGRELYIVPLTPSNVLPEYIDLLDDLKLPQERTEKLLIGVWVLNKGKLVRPSIPAATPIPQPVFPVLSQLPLPSLPSTTLQAAPVPDIPKVINAALASVATPHIDLSALSKEVATLTPEQLELVARSLSQSVPGISALPLPHPTAMNSYPLIPQYKLPSTQKVVPPPVPHLPPPQVPSQPSYPASHSAPPQPPDDGPHLPPPPLGYPTDRSRDRGKGQRRNRSRDYSPGKADDHKWSGGRGRGRYTELRSRDSGWGGRGRGRGGFGSGSASPPRRMNDDRPPQWS